MSCEGASYGRSPNARSKGNTVCNWGQKDDSAAKGAGTKTDNLNLIPTIPMVGEPTPACMLSLTSTGVPGNVLRNLHTEKHAIGEQVKNF